MWYIADNYNNNIFNRDTDNYKPNKRSGSGTENKLKNLFIQSDNIVCKIQNFLKKNHDRFFFELKLVCMCCAILYIVIRNPQ